MRTGIAAEQVPVRHVPAHERMRNMENMMLREATIAGLGALQARSFEEHENGSARFVYRFERGAILLHEDWGRVKIVRDQDATAAQVEAE